MTDPTNFVPTKPEAREAALCKALAQVTGAVVARVDGRRWMTGVQPSWEAYTGQGAEVAFGSGFLDAVHEGDRERLRRAWDASAEEARMLDVEVRVWNAHACRHQLCAWQALPLEVVPGMAIEWLLFLRDLQHGRPQTALCVDDLRMDALRTLARGIAHQLNNLFHGVMLHASIIGRHLSADSLARSSLQHVLRSTERGAEFGRDLLAFSGSGTSKGTSDVSEVLASMQGVLRLLCGPNARLDFALERGLVIADVPTLQHVALSLVQNAVEALGSEQGTIEVRTLRRELAPEELKNSQPSGAHPGPYVCLEVVDDGPGIHEPLRSHIFEPFYANKATGRGLGLPSVLGIVRTWGGFVQIRSEPGHGTCVSVLLPCARELDDARPRDP